MDAVRETAKLCEAHGIREHQADVWMQVAELICMGQELYEKGYHARDAEIERLKWCGCGDEIITPRCPTCAMLDNCDIDVAAELERKIERLKAGIRELQSGITNMAKRYSWLDGDLEDALLEQFEKCGALLKGVKE